VRTVYVPELDVFCKFSLDVRITNCVRKNSWYELAGSPLLTGLLRPVFDELSAAFDGCALLAEPAYRTVALADLRLYEGFGVIVREGVRPFGDIPYPAAALADPGGRFRAEPADPLAWWETYVRLVMPPVLHAFLRYGVVLEPHLQNVLVTLDGDGVPSRAVFRDLEGTKLLPSMWPLDGVPGRIREGLSYDPDRGWNRVVYCLFVNHLAEIAATLADPHPGLEPELWRTARRLLTHDADAHAFPAAAAARLRALLAGVPLPAKANLLTRWSRTQDRNATYIPVPNPLR
jgi:siderophore synthetase component